LPSLVMFFYFALFGSCTPDMVVERLTGTDSEKIEENTITALIPEPKPAEETSIAAQMVLESGNYWTTGVPGFGENALSAFMGEYRVAGKTGMVKVWLTMEFVYYEGWTNRDSITEMTVLEKMGNEGRIAASALNAYWTAVLWFPSEMDLTEEEENTIIVSLIKKFGGFTGQSQNVSLPPLITF